MKETVCLANVESPFSSVQKTHMYFPGAPLLKQERHCCTQSQYFEFPIHVLQEVFTETHILL